MSEKPETNIRDVRLLIADRLKKGEKYRQIEKALSVSQRTIAKVSDLMNQNIIAFDEKEDAFFPHPETADLAEMHYAVHERLTKNATEEVLLTVDTDYAIGKELRGLYFVKAGQLNKTLKEFLDFCVGFWETNKKIIENYPKERALLETMMEAIKRDQVRITKIDYYYRFVTKCLDLRKQGVSIPDTLIENFSADLEAIDKRTLEMWGKDSVSQTII